MELIAKSWLACEWEREFWQPPTEVWIREHERRAKSMEVLFFRYLMNAHGQEVGEDLSFFLNAKRCGFEVHVDCSVRVGHLGQKVFLPSVQTPAGVVPALASHFLPPVKAEVAAPSFECPEPWHWHCYDQMTTEVEVLDFLESLVKMLKPKVVVETGTYLGIGTVHLARGAERVHTAEPVEGNLEKARKLVEEAGLSERVTFHLTTGEEMLRGLAEQIDLAFLDSNLETRMGELRELLPKLKSNGLIAVHDTNTFHVQHGGPRNEILAFAAAKGLQVVNFDTPRGLMLLRRKP